MTIPDEYHGREQTWLKHLVLKEYLSKWGYKLGSVGRKRHTRLWYVDCFAGPWETQTDDVRDSSVSIGLRVLSEVVAEWSAKGAAVSAEAIFVEANLKSYRALSEHVGTIRGKVDAHVLLGEFGTQVTEIQKLLGNDAAFIFVDPTGWKGVGMEHIAQLADRPYRDVMINFMFQYLNRFKGEEDRDWLREQVCAFFGIQDNAKLRGLSETELLEVYRGRLKKLSKLSFALDLAIPDPTRDRTFFHLVCAGRHPEVVALFRDVEATVVGGKAAVARRGARERKEKDSTLSLFENDSASAEDIRYRRLRDQGTLAARRQIEATLADGPRRFGDIWPSVLESVHLRKRDLAAVILEMSNEGALVVEGKTPRQRTVKDDNLLRRAR